MRSVLEAAIRECLTLTSPCSLSRYVSSSRKSAERKQTRGISTNAHNIEETALPYESNKGKQQSIASGTLSTVLPILLSIFSCKVLCLVRNS